MRKLVYLFIGLVVCLGVLAGIYKCSKSEQPVVKDSITFESVVGSDYAYIDSTFKDAAEVHFYEARAYMPERIDSAAAHGTQIDSIVTIFSVDLKVWFFNHKIKGDSVITDTCIYDGPFVEDCEMQWPLPITFKQMMDIVKVNNLKAPNKDIVLRRALIAHPKEYPDFTICGGSWNDWWFISTKDGSVRTDQNSKTWLDQYNKQ